MTTMNLSEIAQIVQGELAGTDVTVTSVSIDTRTLKPGDLYVGIKGHQFDGNTFIEQAEAAGAGAALLHQGFQTALPCITVADTRLALGQLASAWRDKANARIVGITGSNGKTTVKEMVAAILSVDGPVLYTQGNLNNDIGVPLTLLKLDGQHRYGVIEMGANHLGEIAYTSQLAKADVVILNNAGAAHLEGFGNLEGVARAKGEIIETLKQDGIAVLNKDDAYFNYWQGLAGERQIISFGLSGDALIKAKAVSTEIRNGNFVTTFKLETPAGGETINLRLAGQHNVSNALAAAAAGLALGLNLAQIKQGLEQVKPVTGRLQLLTGKLGNLVIDDTYNANATSLKAGLDVLKTCGSKPWLVLGAFGELGPGSARIHQEMGKLIKSSGVMRLLAVGPDAKNTVDVFGEGAVFFASQDELIKALERELTGDEAILIKGSRSQRMENIAAALVDNYRK
jgi:UDP-N-acetylmuramoyl-tripeptide--D-alanyl-D-alanine ligase